MQVQKHRPLLYRYTSPRLLFAQSYSEIYRLADASSTVDLFGGATISQVAYANTSSSILVGHKVRALKVSLRRQGTISAGDLVAQVWDATGAKSYELGRIACSSITTDAAFAPYTFTNPISPFKMLSGWAVGVVLSGTAQSNTDASNFIQVRNRTTDVIDTTNTIRGFFNVSFQTEATDDFPGVVWE